MDVTTEHQPGRLVFDGDGAFFRTLRSRVTTHFDGRKRCDDMRLHRKAWLVAAWFTVSFVLLLLVETTWLQIVLCISYAFAACALGFNVFHDANHGSLTTNKRVNLWVSRLTCAALGPSRYLWGQKHHALHHVYTNVYLWDDDIETRGHLRMSPEQPWEPKYRYQHLYFVVLYAVSTVEWFFVKDFVQYFTLRTTHRPIPPMSRNEKVEFWVTKGIYVGGFVLLPFAFQPAGRVLVGLLLFHALFGLALTFVFQIAHGTEKVEFPVPVNGEPAVIREEWAAHEMRTTVNFAPTNRFLNWFTGGLNFQVEHHLFPHMSHTHYPDICAIVRGTAIEFGLPYNVHATYIEAARSHYRFLRDLARQPQGT